MHGDFGFGRQLDTSINLLKNFMRYVQKAWHENERIIYTELITRMARLKKKKQKGFRKNLSQSMMDNDKLSKLYYLVVVGRKVYEN